MVLRIAAVMSLVAFALCVVVGGVEANNPFGTTVKRALEAMFATLVIGLVVGSAFKAMLKENLTQEEKKLKAQPANPVSPDR